MKSRVERRRRAEAPGGHPPGRQRASRASGLRSCSNSDTGSGDFWGTAKLDKRRNNALEISRLIWREINIRAICVASATREKDIRYKRR